MIRIATIEDAAQMLQIYRPAIEDNAVSFEEEIPSVEEIERRIVSCLQVYPWLVEEQNGSLRGYAYAGLLRHRAAYRWSVESTVYVGSEHWRQGVGRRLYRVLFAILEAQRFCQVYAGITCPNPGSVGLHRACGFAEVGVFPQVGFKLDAWHDVLWMHRSLRNQDAERPQEPIPFAELADNYQGDLSARS